MVVLLQPAEEYNILKGSIIMSLLETWRNLAYEQEMDDQKYQMFWATYFNFEKGVYEQILAAKLYGTLPPDPQNSEYGSSNAAS